MYCFQHGKFIKRMIRVNFQYFIRYFIRTTYIVTLYNTNNNKDVARNFFRGNWLDGHWFIHFQDDARYDIIDDKALFPLESRHLTKRDNGSVEGWEKYVILEFSIVVKCKMRSIPVLDNNRTNRACIPATTKIACKILSVCRTMIWI